MNRTVTFRRYVPERDYMRIRELLIDTFSLYGGPFTWLIDRWNFCTFHVIPLHKYYSSSYFNVPTRPHTDHRDDLPLWQNGIGVWETSDGSVVAAAHSENEEPGEAWIRSIRSTGFFTLRLLISSKRISQTGQMGMDS